MQFNRIAIATLLVAAWSGLGWICGQGSLIASIERAYIAMFDSTARDSSVIGKYRVTWNRNNESDT